MKIYFNSFFLIFLISLLILILIGCEKNCNYGMYTVFVNTCNTRIDMDLICLKMTIHDGIEEKLQLEKVNVFTNPATLKDSTTIAQFTTRHFEQIIGHNVVLNLAYGIDHESVVIDTQEIQEEKVYFTDIYIGVKSIGNDSIQNYTSKEFNFDGIIDTVYFKK